MLAALKSGCILVRAKYCGSLFAQGIRDAGNQRSLRADYNQIDSFFKSKLHDGKLVGGIHVSNFDFIPNPWVARSTNDIVAGCAGPDERFDDGVLSCTGA